MNFEFSDEQKMVRDSLSRLLSDTYDFEARNKILASDAGWSQDTWKTLAELGILSAAFGEEYDGFGGTASDTLIIMEQLGAALCLEPFLPTVILCGKLLAEIGGEVATDLIAQICAGELIMGLGHSEPKSRFSLSRVDTAAVKSGDSYVLNGHKSVVLAAPIAGKLIVSARTSGDAQDESGISLFLLDTDTAGVNLQPYKNIDGHIAGDVSLDDVKVPASALLGAEGEGFKHIQSVTNGAIMAVTAEAIGLAKQMCKLTNEYIQTRKQFGIPIGKFQVLQHKMVDMFIHQEEVTSMAYMAAAKMDSEGYDLNAAMSAAKVQLGKSCKFIGENAVQLHGGMGITEEMAIGHYFMRGTMLDAMFGNMDYHIGQYVKHSEAA
ncbi:MAG: acyl-CoA dehydrogenase family protein [Maricaulaceae bacterium]